MAGYYGGGGGGGGTCPPTFIISETIRRADAPVMRLVLPETQRRSDLPKFTYIPPETQRRSDLATITLTGAPLWQSEAHADLSAAASSITVSKPPGVVLGRLMLAFVDTASVLASPAPQAPAGWTQAAAITQTGAAQKSYSSVFYKIAGTYTTPDTSGNGRTGTVIAVPTFSASGMTTDGVDRDDATSGVNCGVTGFGVSTADGSCKVKATIRRSRTGVSEAIAGKWGTSGGLNGQYQLFINASNFLCFSVSNFGFTAVGTTSLTTGVDYDVEGEWTGTVIRVKVATVQEGTTPALTTFTSDATVPFYIGRFSVFDATDTPSPNPFGGTIKNVEMYRGGVLQGQYALTSSTGVDSEPSSYAFPFAASADQATAEIHHIAGANQNSPINILAQQAFLLGIGNPADPVNPSVTTTAGNCLVFAHLWHSHLALSQSHTPPASNTEATDFQSAVAAVIWGSTTDWRQFTTAGATGTAVHDCTEAVNTDAVVSRIAINGGSFTITV